MARPSKRSDSLVAEICERLAQGEPLATICRDDHMPAFSTIWRWEEDDEEFRNLSARARIHGTHYIADDCLRISDDPALEPADKRVRIDARIRLIGKWNSRQYGDKQQIEHSGSIDMRQQFLGME